MLVQDLKKEKLSVTIEPINKSFLQDLADQKGQSVSESVDEILEFLRVASLKEEMKKGYQEMASDDLKIAQEFDSIIRLTAQ